MDCEIIINGSGDEMKNIISDFVYVKKGDIVVVSVPKNLCKYVLNQLKEAKIECLEYTQYVQTINTEVIKSTLNPIKTPEVFKWLENGANYFYILSANTFEMHSIDKKNVKLISTAEGVNKCYLSNDGSIYALIKGNSVSFHIGEKLDMFWDITLEKTIVKVEMSQNSKIVAIFTSSTTKVYDLFSGKFLFDLPTTDTYFVNNNLYIPTLNKMIDPIQTESQLLGDDIKNMTINEITNDISCTVFNNNKKAQFIDGQLQRVIVGDKKELTKTYMKVVDVEFKFAENRVYALLIIKQGKDDERYTFDSFMDSEVTSNAFDSKVLQVSVSDNMFAVQLADYEVLFYIKEKHAFRCINKIKKSNSVLISVNNSICVIFDNESNTLEFYDKAMIRGTFLHNGCTNLKWSENGLYLASYSCSQMSGGLVQIFDCNGVLMLKKIFNSLRDFSWRSFPCISEDEKSLILNEHNINEIEEPEDEETVVRMNLRDNWIKYLKSKIVEAN